MRYPCLIYAFLCCCFYGMALPSAKGQTAPDPGIPGTYAVAKDEYNLGDLAFKPDSLSSFVELRGSVHYPATLTGGPFPVIVLLHGRHATTYKSSTPSMTGMSWPPPTGYQSITSFEGYDYFAENMASHGYIVISISANGINAVDAAASDNGMNARGQLVQKHLDLWKDYNIGAAGPFGPKFVGKLDMGRVGTMGHSRGGEGVVFNALLNRSLGSPYGIKAVLTLAPVNFKRKVLNHIPLMNIAPYCDGDVVGLGGVRYYDDARYSDTLDERPKHSVLMMGANHNFFNTVWTPGAYIAGTSDDWDAVWGATSDNFCGSKKPGNGRLDTGTQKAAFIAYAAAFFRTYLGNDTSFRPILEADVIRPPASSGLDSTQVYVSYHAGSSRRADINRVDKMLNTTVNTMGGAVSSSGMVSAAACGGGLSTPLCGIATSVSQEPHRGTASYKGLLQANLQWDNKTDYYQNEIPAGSGNAAKYRNLSFRVAVNFKKSMPAGKDPDFTVQLEDALGKISSRRLSAHSRALFFQPGNTSGALPKVLFNTVKIPLDQFPGINQTNIRYVRFLFDTVGTGALLFSDLAWTDVTDQPCGTLDAKFKDSLDKGYLVYFKDSSVANTGDSLVWSWNFGDPASGTWDTSSQQHPNHRFPAAGSYKVCQYLSAYRPNGLVCTDTFCKTISLLPNSIGEWEAPHISIRPNPAKDYLLISGSGNKDVLELLNLYGQLVFQTTISQAQVFLPAELSAGLYFVRIHTASGTVVYKIILEK